MEPNLRPGEDLQHYLERQASEMQQRASALQEAFSVAGATVTSRDGAVTVTLEPNGALRSLQLGKRACELGPARLTTTIMDAVRQAQRQTAHSVAGSVESIVGGGETLDMIKSFLPPEPATGSDADQNKFVEPPEPEQPPAAPPQPAAPPAKPAPRRRPARDDADEDEGNPW